jgi:hypothetical protein
MTSDGSADQLTTAASRRPAGRKYESFSSQDALQESGRSCSMWKEKSGIVAYRHDKISA